jgi:hypothetical protein
MTRLTERTHQGAPTRRRQSRLVCAVDISGHRLLGDPDEIREFGLFHGAVQDGEQVAGFPKVCQTGDFRRRDQAFAEIQERVLPFVVAVDRATHKLSIAAEQQT